MPVEGRKQGVILKFQLVWLVLLLVLWPHVSAADEPSQLPVSYAEVNGLFEPEQADSLSFHRYAAGYRLPLAEYPAGVVLRLKIPGSVVHPEAYNLVLRPKYLADVTLWFKQQGDDYWRSEKRGRLLPNKPSYYSPQTLVYELPAGLDDAAFLYLVIRDSGMPKPVSITLEGRGSFLEEDVRISHYTLVLYAIMLVLAIVNLIVFAYIRELPFLYYSIYVLLALGAVVWQEGWAGEWLYLSDSVSTSRWLHFFSMLPAVFFYQFYRSYLGLDRRTFGGKLILGFQFGFVAILVLSQVDSYWSDVYFRNIWVTLFNGVMALGAITIFVLTLRYWVLGQKVAAYLFIANFLLIVATLVRVYYAFTFSPEIAYWQTHAFEIALAVNAMILFLALASRTLHALQERDQAKVDLVRVDTAYQREQLLADFVRKLQSLVTDDENVDVSREMDGVFFESINSIIDVVEVMVLTMNGGKAHYRCLGRNKVMGRLFMQVFKQQMPRFLQDCRSGLITRRNIRGFPDAREQYQYLLVPVKTREEMGYCLVLLVPQQQYLDRDMVSGLREFVEKAVHARMEAENMEQLRYSARYDELTGVLNRGSMESRIGKQLAHCRKGGNGLALAFVDIDHFKMLNDSMGHDFGDLCLRLLCRTIQQIVPKAGLVGRFGGDEFLVLLPGLDYQQASQLLEKLNPALVVASRKEKHVLSVSVGIADCLPGQRMSMADLFKQADMSLYAAKAAGRACIGPRVAKAKTGE